MLRLGFLIWIGAGGVWAATSGYAPVESCAGCHASIAERYGRTGMGRSFQAVRVRETLGEFDGRVMFHEGSRQHFTPAMAGGRAVVRRHQVGVEGRVGNVVEKAVDYVLGSGNHAKSYVHRTGNQRLIELPVSWYSDRGGHWGMSPGYDRPDHSGFSREISYRCFFCHAGYPALEPAAAYPDAAFDAGAKYPAELPGAIDCQRCHGRGLAHVQAARAGRTVGEIRASILNPARLAAGRQLEVCYQCHLETTSALLPPAVMRPGRTVFSYDPAEPLTKYVLFYDHAAGSGHEDKFELVSAPYRLAQSRCFRESAGKMTCTSCHDPHDAPRGAEAVRAYTRACEGCHAGNHAKGSDCVSCHMARRRPTDAVHTVITDHLIAARPVRVADPVVEPREGAEPPYTGRLVPYLVEAGTELETAAAQLRQQSNLGSLGELERLLGERRPAAAEFYFDAGEAWRNAGFPERGLRWYEQAVARGGGYWRYSYGYGLALLAAGQNGRALAAFERAQGLNREEASVPYARGEALRALGKMREAITAYREALRLDGEQASVWNNLGTALLGVGDVAGARAALTESVRLRPEVGASHLNLASVLLRGGAFAEAEYELGETLRIGAPLGEARAAYLFGIASGEDAGKARLRFFDALAHSGQVADAHLNLGILVSGRDGAAAVRHYRQALEARPEFPTAWLNLGAALAGLGQRAEGLQWLRRAAESREEGVREAARRAIERLGQAVK